MGEITRAVLQSQCVLSVPYWYGDQQSFQGAGFLTPTTVTGNFHTDQDSWFMLTHICFAGASNLTGSAAGSILAPTGIGTTNPYFQSRSRFSLKNLNNNKEFFQNETLLLNVCTDITDTAELFEYIYLEPGARLKWSVTWLDSLAGFSVDIINFTFGGIRFYMP